MPNIISMSLAEATDPFDPEFLLRMTGGRREEPKEETEVSKTFYGAIDYSPYWGHVNKWYKALCEAGMRPWPSVWSDPYPEVRKVARKALMG